MGGQQHPGVMGRQEAPLAPLVLQCPELEGHTQLMGEKSIGQTQVERAFAISVIPDYVRCVFWGK